MLEGLEKTVLRTGWEIFSFVWMPNHIHLFFRTPQPNLSRGMQYLLSGYANWYAKRHQRPGHLFQGRLLRSSLPSTGQGFGLAENWPLPCVSAK